VIIMDGGDKVRQAVVNQLRIHFPRSWSAPGRRCSAPTPPPASSLRQVDVTISPHATHLTYEITKE
jgi:hypothetical protein